MKNTTPPQPVLHEQLEYLHNLNQVVCDLSTYLEHIEHCEPAKPEVISRSSETLLKIVTSLAQKYNVDLASVYANRLKAIEGKRGPFITTDNHGTQPSGAKRVAEAKTWHQLQIGQFIHDQECHSNIINNPEHQQLKHYTYHIAKLPASLSEAILESNISGFVESGRFADILAFGVKLAILCKKPLTQTPLPNHQTN